MKKILLVLLLICTPCFAEVKQEPQKFKVVYEVTYNELTLQEAAKKEGEVKAQHKKACGVDVKILKIEQYSSSLDWTTSTVSTVSVN